MKCDRVRFRTGTTTGTELRADCYPFPVRDPDPLLGCGLFLREIGFDVGQRGVEPLPQHDHIAIALDQLKLSAVVPIERLS